MWALEISFLAGSSLLPGSPRLNIAQHPLIAATHVENEATNIHRPAVPRHKHVGHLLRLANYNCQNKGAFVRPWGSQAVVVEVGSYRGEEIRQFKGVRKFYAFEPAAEKEPFIRRAIHAAGMDAQVRALRAPPACFFVQLVCRGR